MIRLFTGWDQREAAGWHAFVQSVHERTSAPVSVTPLVMNMQRDGTNSFTYSRFLVPHLCNFDGFAIFVDGADMICLGDLAELWEMRSSGGSAVKVVKHDYKTRHPRKYVGTEMESPNESYPRKNWSSVMIFDCGHYMNRCLEPKFIAEKDGAYLHRFGWLPDDRIGDLPREWNWLCDEYGANTQAKILHWTAGIPAIYAYRNSPQAQAWQFYSARAAESPAAHRIAEVASAR